MAEDNERRRSVFDQKHCMFLTHVMACQVNSKIDIKNSDPIGHNTKIDPQKGVPFNQNLPAKQTRGLHADRRRGVAGPVSCSIHPWMRAYMLPRKDKYFAVTKPDGSFEIPNLPAGEEVETAGLARAGQRVPAVRWCCPRRI